MICRLLLCMWSRLETRDVMRFPETAVFQDDKVVKLTNMEGELLETASLEMDLNDYLARINRFLRGN